MNIYLVQLLSKILSILFMLVASFFNIFNISKEEITVNNLDSSKGSKVVNTVVEYETIYKYNPKIPVNNQKVLWINTTSNTLWDIIMKKDLI